MTTLNSHELRIATLETDSSALSTKLTVLEATVEKGFTSLEKRFDSLEDWLAERL